MASNLASQKPAGFRIAPFHRWPGQRAQCSFRTAGNRKRDYHPTVAYAHAARWPDRTVNCPTVRQLGGQAKDE